MMSHSSAPRSLLLAGAFLSAFTLGCRRPAARRIRRPPAHAACGRAASAGIAVDRAARRQRSRRQARAGSRRRRSPPRRTSCRLAKLKVPAGFNIEVYAAGMANARSLAVGDKGTVFVGSRLVDKVYAIVNKDGKRDGQGAGLRPLPAERRRVQGRHALHRRTVEDLQDRQGRGRSSTTRRSRP